MKISNNYKFMVKITAIFVLMLIFGINVQKVSAFEDFSSEQRLAYSTANPIQNVDFGPYMKRMQDKIKANWAPPVKNMTAQIVVKYRILKNGSLDSYGITASSGSQELDNAAIDALRRSAPFEPLPESFNKESILVQFTFDYQKPQEANNLPSEPSNTMTNSMPQQTVQSAPRQIRTLAISPLGDAAASTFKPASTNVQQNAYNRQNEYTNPAVYGQSNSQVRTNVVSTSKGTRISAPAAGSQQYSLPASSNNRLTNQVPSRNVSTRTIVTPSQGTLITTAASRPAQVNQNIIPTVVNNQMYSSGTALAPPSVNPRRTIDIDTFAEPNQLPLTVPLDPNANQIASVPTILRASTPVTSKEINRVALPVIYDPEIERVVVEDDLPPIETPTLSVGINKVAPPPIRRYRVVQPQEYVEQQPQPVEPPTYIAAPAPAVNNPPVEFTPVVVPDFAAYMAKVERKITRKWKPPFSDYSTQVVVNYIIKKNGELGKYHIAKSSGNSRMDVSATKALEKAAPFPPLPKGFDEDSVDVKFTFDYNVYKNKSEKNGIKDLEEESEEI